MTDEQVRALVSGELDRMPAGRRAALQPFIVDPAPVAGSSNYEAGVKHCWTVAKFDSLVILYSPGGGVGSYPWGISSPDAPDLAGDDAWHVSLDDAFMCSGLCDRALVPSDYEVP